MFEAPWHWVIVALVVIALFGYNKLPDAARSLGRSLRIFKTEIKGMGEDDKAREAAAQQREPAPPPIEAAPEPHRVPPADGGSTMSVEKPPAGAP